MSGFPTSGFPTRGESWRWGILIPSVIRITHPNYDTIFHPAALDLGRWLQILGSFVCFSHVQLNLRQYIYHNSWIQIFTKMFNWSSVYIFFSVRLSHSTLCVQQYFNACLSQTVCVDDRPFINRIELKFIFLDYQGNLWYVECVKIDHWWYIFICCFRLPSREAEYLQR